MIADTAIRPLHDAALRPPTVRRWWADAAGLAAWGSVLVVVALWVHGGNVGDLAGGAAPALTALGRVAGLVSADLLLWQVLAMARIPWLERSLGQDRLARWHRVLGFTSVNLMLGHIVLITVGYALGDGNAVLAELWSLVTTAPGMLLAAAGTVLVVMLAVTSVRVARRRLRYESWHLLHLYAYLGVGLALPHQLWTGADFLSSPAATAYWWGLWAVAAASVLAFRVALPLRLSLRHRIAVTRVDVVSPGVISIEMAGHRLHDLRAAAGQFFVWRFLTGPGWTRGHPLSLSAAPTASGLRVTMNARGDDGARLAGMRPGTRVLVEGPHGRLTPLVRTRPALALLGSGLGLAPLVAVLQDAVRRGAMDRPAVLVRRSHATGANPFDADVQPLVDAGWLRVVDLPGPRSTTGTPWLPAASGHVPGPQALRTLVPDIDERDVYVCGASAWVTAVEADARAAGIDADALHVEHFTW